MRIVLIDYGASTPITSAFMGYVGEHNETAVRITPSDEMQADESIATFVAAMECDGKLYHSAAATREDVVATGYFTVPLTSDLTQSEIIKIQLEAYGANSSLIAKADSFIGYFAPSLDGDEAEITGDAGIIADVEANTAFRKSYGNPLKYLEFTVWEDIAAGSVFKATESSIYIVDGDATADGKILHNKEIIAVKAIQDGETDFKDIQLFGCEKSQTTICTMPVYEPENDITIICYTCGSSTAYEYINSKVRVYYRDIDAAAYYAK